jgi:hypothetical protein
MDSILAPPQNWMRVSQLGAQQFESAKNHLALGDTAGAEARLAAIEQAFGGRRFEFSVRLMYDGAAPWVGRAWLLSGDLSAAGGQLPEAARMYRRVIGLWGGGDPGLQPVVDAARARLESLPVRGGR